MRYKLKTGLPDLMAYLPEFLALVGEPIWRRKIAELKEMHSASPFQEKIVSDYHWLEISLDKQLMIATTLGRVLPDQVNLKSTAALHFVGTIVEVYQRLTSKGRANLKGRILDALKAETGFASLYLEMGMAQLCIRAGYDVEFSDLEGNARYDLRYSTGHSTGEVECKSQSADAGRKIHRKDFYRFIDALGPLLLNRADQGECEVLVIHINGRFPSASAKHSELTNAATHVLLKMERTVVEGSFFRLEYEDFNRHLAGANLNQANFYATCQKVFGENCHVSGISLPKGTSIVVMRSDSIDDISKPLLEAMRKGATQLSGDNLGVIAVQFTDIKTEDLVLPHLRRRAGILSSALFSHYGASHVAATYFCPYDGLSSWQGRIGAPAFIVLNPKPKYQPDRKLTQSIFSGVPDTEFAMRLGAPSPKGDIYHFNITDEGK